MQGVALLHNFALLYTYSNLTMMHSSEVDTPFSHLKEQDLIILTLTNVQER